MTIASNVLMVLGALVTGYGLIRVWRRTSPTHQHIGLVGIPSAEAFGTPTVTSDEPRQRRSTWRRWLRFGRPVQHSADANLSVTVTPQSALVRRPPPTQEERLARIEQELDTLAGENASALAQEREHNAIAIKQEIADYQATERTRTRRQTLIAGIGLLMTFSGIVLRILNELVANF